MKICDEVMKVETREIYRFNTSDDCRYPVMKQCFELSEKNVYDLIVEEFNLFENRVAPLSA